MAQYAPVKAISVTARFMSGTTDKIFIFIFYFGIKMTLKHKFHWYFNRDNHNQHISIINNWYIFIRILFWNKGTYFDETDKLIRNLSVCCLIMASRFQSINTDVH